MPWLSAAPPTYSCTTAGKGFLNGWNEPGSTVGSPENEAVYHSSGRFTLDPQKALEKLASKALTDPATGTLKLVQAFVRAGCRRLAVQFHNDRWVLAPDSDARLDPNRIASLLQTGGLPDEVSAEADLVRALVYLWCSCFPIPDQERPRSPCPTTVVAAGCGTPRLSAGRSRCRLGSGRCWHAGWFVRCQNRPPPILFRLA